MYDFCTHNDKVADFHYQSALRLACLSPITILRCCFESKVKNDCKTNKSLLFNCFWLVLNFLDNCETTYSFKTFTIRYIRGLKLSSLILYLTLFCTILFPKFFNYF